MKKARSLQSKVYRSMGNCGGGSIPEELSKKHILNNSPYTNDK